MATRVYEGSGAAEYNKGEVIARIESIGPVTLSVHNQGSHEVVIAASKQSDDSIIASDKDTAVSSEDTLYNGDGSTLAFSGEDLNNVPILPGSVTITDSASVGPDLIDRDADGILYTSDTDEDAAGTIDYFTGALVLAYPTGKAPGTGADAINAAYTYQDALTVPGGKRSFELANVLNGETVVVRAACDNAAGSFVKVDGIATWV